MIRIGIWLMAIAVAAGSYFLLTPGEFMPPSEFPVLTSPSRVSAPQAAAPELATFGSGCFWCTEAVFQQLRGVSDVTSGYAGGKVPNPSYAQVCTGTTGHAEVIQLKYDPAVVSYAELLEVFWRSHDPTTLNRQGADVGTQYRSVVFTHTPEQRKQAEEYKAKINEAKVYSAPLVTEIAPATQFYAAGADHQDFFALNPNQPYCQAVIGPKLQKLNKLFADKLKK